MTFSYLREIMERRGVRAQMRNTNNYVCFSLVSETNNIKRIQIFWETLFLNEKTSFQPVTRRRQQAHVSSNKIISFLTYLQLFFLKNKNLESNTVQLYLSSQSLPVSGWWRLVLGSKKVLRESGKHNVSITANCYLKMLYLKCWLNDSNIGVYFA